MTSPGVRSFLLDAVNGWRTDPRRSHGVTLGDGVLELAASGEEGGRRRRGVWVSQPLDSGILACVWHRLVLDVDVPEGVGLRVSTWTWEEPEESASELWVEGFSVAGEPAASKARSGELPDAPGARIQEGLVQSRGGRFLRLRLELDGDGVTTPRVRSLRVHFPRETWLQHLPAVYSGNEAQRFFLGRFLSIFQTPWRELETQIATVSRLFDPKTVPGPFLSYLASWLGQPLEGTWDEAENRRLLVRVPELLPRRGTPEALRRFVRVYLANLSGLPERRVRPFPVVVEDYRLRRPATLDESRLGGATVASTNPFDRLRLDFGAPVGEARIVSTGDPRTDVFAASAYRFTVYVPAVWIRDAAGERLVRRAVEEEKPAATSYRLRRVEPALTVGVQSTVGVDTIIGQEVTP